MKFKLTFYLFMLVLCIVGQNALASDLTIYPAQGQSPEQLDKDKYECYSWAKKQTGFDPMAQPTASAPPPQQEAQKGGVGRGAARGVAVGAAVGSFDGEAGKGAKKGAATGAVVGGVRRNQQKKAQQQKEQQWAQEQSSQYTQQRNAYNKAQAACLEGRGYSVK
jgi:hypothetical protein